MPTALVRLRCETKDDTGRVNKRAVLRISAWFATYQLVPFLYWASIAVFE